MSQRIVRSAPIIPGLPGTHSLILPALVIVGIGAFLLVKLRAGQDWDGDFALYAMNAHNILDGLPYAKTPYLFNPANAINPTAYPPGLPLLFVPVMYFRGLDLPALKIECILALTVFLWVFWELAREQIGYLPALLVTAAIGLHPFVVRSSNLLNSEFSFMLFCYSALLLFERLQSGLKVPQATVIKYVLLAALVTAFACLTRSIGLLLLLAAFVSSAWRTKRLLSPTTAALAGALLLYIAIQSVYPGDVGTYVHYFDQFTPRGLMTNAYLYLHAALTMLGTSRVAIGFCATVLIAAAIGFCSRLRALSVLECFFAFYIGFLIVYPIDLEVKRYEMPIWPLLFIYFAHGVNLITRAAHAIPRRGIIAAIVIGTFLLYARELWSLDYGPISYSVLDARAEQLFEAIRKLPLQSRVLSRWPTIVALYTGHTSSTWPPQFTDGELYDYLERSHIDTIVQDHPHLAADSALDDLDRFIDRHRSSLQSVFANDWFSVYRVNAQARRLD